LGLATGSADELSAPEKKIGALGVDILKKQRFGALWRMKWQSTKNNDSVAPPGKWNGKIEIL